ncbi:MAG: tripartite tricarboxylate transporter substrate binding protein [Betaproteobacteria bacterium]|nr:tripartite tricarboxylate transporter substrate binding protein [Betaproteobacteria bacterium]
MKPQPLSISALLRVACALSALAAAPAIQAQSYPGKAIRFVVPFPPGGPLDISARAIAQKLNEAWKQPVVIDNRPGAGGNIGAENVAKSAPDGYSILMGAVSTHAINPTLYAKMPYDALRDFAPITLVTTVPNVLVVHPSLPAKNVRELIALARARPGQLTFASGSTGSTGHLAGELFKTMAKVDMVHVPYKGAAPAATDLVAGHVSLMFDNLASALPQIKAGRTRALALTTIARSAMVPELPTIDESGLKGFDLTTWFGVFAPAGVPEAILGALHREITRALDSADVRSRLAALGAQPTPNTPQAFAAFIKAEQAKYALVIKASGARVD